MSLSLFLSQWRIHDFSLWEKLGARCSNTFLSLSLCPIFLRLCCTGDPTIEFYGWIFLSLSLCLHCICRCLCHCLFFFVFVERKDPRLKFMGGIRSQQDEGHVHSGERANMRRCLCAVHTCILHTHHTLY